MLNPNNKLYVHEHYKFDSQEKEIAEFNDHVRRVLKAQQALAGSHAPGNPQRVFHAKAHACLAGKLTLREDRPESTRHGIFASHGKNVYNVLARFSNGLGFDQHDLKPDVRGIALKIFGVSDAFTSAQKREPQALDLLMTNSTNPFGKDQEEFVQFMEASVDPGVLGFHLIAFLIAHTEVAKLLMKATLRIVPSLLTEQDRSGHPYLLGPHQAMKINVRPIEESRIAIDDELRKETFRFQAATVSGSNLEDQVKGWFDMQMVANSKINPNYLSVELRDRLQRGPIGFVLSVQLEKDALTTPIEDSIVEWTESDSPSIPVAELVLDREIEADICTNLKFTPGHCVPDHRPLGNMGRGRIFTYEASQVGRNASADEPTERMLLQT